MEYLIMTPQAYIKTFGLDTAKKTARLKTSLIDDNEFMEDKSNGEAFIKELKRLIYSHEFVEYMGGVFKAKQDADQLEKSARFMHCMSRVPDISSEPMDENEIREQAAKLKQAVADVESCQ